MHGGAGRSGTGHGDDVDEVAAYYENTREEDRLGAGLGGLELARTQEVLRRHLAGGALRIVDVGGGTGVHAGWLAADGHSVHVVDIAPRHVARVREDLGERGVTADVADARTLPLADAAFDAVLLLGPLYHLTERTDRLAALHEACRVVRTGGLIAVAAISRFASLHDGLARGFLFDSAFREIVEADLRDGQHRNSERRPGWFTTAYFHRPEELHGEIEEVGLEVIEIVGIEGLAGWLDDLEAHWATAEGRETILAAARAVEAEPSVLGASAHLLAVTRRR